MIQSIVQYLNLRLETLGRIADLHGISERRKRESDGANVPYCYVGSGEFKAVNIDNGNVGWWRPRGGFSMEPVEVIGRAVRQQRATYPLRFVAILRRELSVSDDAFMPSRLAEDIANALNFDNGDLRGILKAINVEARASGGEFDAATIWPTEFQTSIPDLRYELAMVAVDVTVEVVGRYSCWEGECATDTDILHLFNFCDPSVVARLTPAQVECLQVIAEDANWELYNTEGTLLSTGSIPSGDTDSIVAPDATVLINGNQFDTVASGDAIDLPVVNGGSNPVGSEQSGEWVIGNSTVTINGTQVGDIVAEDSLPIAVELDGNPSGTWNAGTQTWEVTSTPCADATFSIDGVQVDTVASGADLDVSVELNGNPVMPTYNSGTKVIEVTGGVSAALSVSVSDATPDFGDTITITATATGFTPTDYYFFAKQGTALLNIGSAAGGVINWTVTLNGSFEIFAQAHNNTASAFNIGGESVTSQSAIVTANLQLRLDPFLSNIVAPTYPDLSGLGRNGTLVNSPTVVVGSMAPNDGGYIGLNGVNQYIGSIGTVADFAFVQNTRVFSMGGFFYIGSTTTYSPLIANSVTSSKKGFVLSLRGDLSKEIRVSLTDGSGITGNIIFFDSPSNAITSIGWYHIYATYTGVGGVAQIYLNGSPIATTVTGTAAPPTGNSTDPLRIGSESLNVFFMNGRIGPVQIYNAALTAGQVQMNFNTDRSRYGL